MARKLIVELIGDTSSLDRALKRSSRNAQQFGRQMEKADKASRSLGGFGRGAVAGFAGAAALQTVIDTVRSVVSAAAESQQVLGQTQVALDAAGLSWNKYGDQIQEAVRAQSKFGFDDEALLRTFQLFVRSTGNVDEALRRNTLAMDVARGRYIDIEQAANLVNKAAMGQAGALRRVGINAKVGSSGIQLLTLLSQKYGGAAEKASGDASTSMQRFSVEVENLKESIGTLLLPVVTQLATNIGAVADASSRAVDKLHDLGNVKIPSIELPFHITVGGQDIGTRLKGAGGMALRSMPGIGPLLTFMDRIKKAQRDAATAGGTQPRPDIGFRGVDFSEVIKKQAAELKKARAAAARLAQLRNQWFDAMIGRRLARVSDLPVQQQLAALQKISALITRRIAVTNDITRQLNLEDQLLAVNQQKASVRAAMVQGFLDRLAFNVDKAGLTRSLQDDLAALNVLQAAIEKRIRIEGHTLDLDRQLLDVQMRRKDLLEQQAAARREQARAAREAAKQAREAALAARTARQFAALGLGPTGEDIVPGVENLRKRFADLRVRLKGTGIANGRVVEQIGKVLAGRFGKVTADVRSKIDEMFDSWSDALKQGRNDLVTKFRPIDTSKFVERLGLGLTPAQTRRLRGALAGLGPGMTAPTGRTQAFALAGGVTINGGVHMHGVQDVAGMENELTKRAMARSHRRRGAR